MSGIPIFSTLSTSYINSIPLNTNTQQFFANYPLKCKDFSLIKKHRYLTLIYVHLGGDSLSWWNTIDDLRMNENIIVYDLNLNISTTNSISVYRIDDQPNDISGYGCNSSKTIEFKAYMESCKIFYGSCGSSSSEKLVLLKNAFLSIFNERDSDEIAIQYSGHGDGKGGLFSNFLSKGPLIQNFFDSMTNNGQNKFLFGHFATNCYESTDEVMRTRGPYFKYLTLSSKSVGVKIDDPTTMGFKLKNYWGKSKFPISINPFLYINPSNVINALTYTMDITKNIWTLGAKNNIIATLNKQNVSLFDTSLWLTIQSSLRNQLLVPIDGSIIKLSKDLKLIMDQFGLHQYIFQSFRIYSVSNEDLFNWQEVDNGIYVNNIANLIGHSEIPNNILSEPKNVGLYSMGISPGKKIAWNVLPGASCYIIGRDSSDSKYTRTYFCVNGTNYIDSTANQIGVIYYYNLYAIDAYMNSSLSGFNGMTTIK